jgi:hypothetical protein
MVRFVGRGVGVGSGPDVAHDVYIASVIPTAAKPTADSNSVNVPIGLHLDQLVRMRLRDRETVFLQSLNIELDGPPDERTHLFSGFRSGYTPWQVRHVGSIASWSLLDDYSVLQDQPLPLGPPASRHCATSPEAYRRQICRRRRLSPAYRGA